MFVRNVLFPALMLPSTQSVTRSPLGASTSTAGREDEDDDGDEKEEEEEEEEEANVAIGVLLADRADLTTRRPPSRTPPNAPRRAIASTGDRLRMLADHAREAARGSMPPRRSESSSVVEVASEAPARGE